MNGPEQNKDRTERVARLSRRTRQDIVKCNQMTALRFQTGGQHQASLASFWGDKPHDYLVTYSVLLKGDLK